MQTSSRIHVMIVDDIEPLRERYAMMLKDDPLIEVVAQADDKASAIYHALNTMPLPDVILMDIDMDTHTAGLEATKEILAIRPDVKIIISTVYEDDDKVFTAFQLGVSDYLLKNSLPLDLITCIKDAFYNRSPIRPVIAEKIRLEFQRIRKNEGSFLYCLSIVSQLTQTELDILDLTAQGYTRQQICDIRCVELSTVKTQIRNILKKFKMNTLKDIIENLHSSQVFEYLHNIPKIQIK